MRAVTEEGLRKKLSSFDGLPGHIVCSIQYVLEQLIEECQEIDTLIDKEPDLILAAEKYAEKYSADDGDYIKTDVLNAFYHGAYWREMNEQKIQRP